LRKTIVLAYSGGLRSSAAIPWLAERYDAEIATVTVGVGQSAGLVEIRDRALAAGAVRAHVLDAVDEFARDLVLPALKADALSAGRYPMATALTRPLIASKLVAIARIEGAGLVAHGCRGRDRTRVSKPLRRLDAALHEIAAGEDMTQSLVVEYADRIGLSVPAIAADRVDDNLWGRTVGRRGDDASGEAPESCFVLTRPLDRTAPTPAVVELAFERGVPAGINGVTMPLAELIDSLAIIAGEHGVGRLERVKTHTDGSRSRALYEAPAAVVLHLARQDLARCVSSDRLMRVARSIGVTYAEVIERGEWFDRLRPGLESFVASTEAAISGVVRVRLFKGDCRVVSRSTVDNLQPPNP
jgi:argininosuccinate synthase